MSERLAAARAATYDRDRAVRLAAVHELAELAMAPGGEALEAVLALEDCGWDPAMREAARTAVATIVRTVPPPGWPERFTYEPDGPPAIGVAELWGIAEPLAFDPVAWWRQSAGLSVPIGAAPDGRPVRLDVRDAPHVLIIGATGSGKTELLRTLVLGLAATHPPDEVNLLLVDHVGNAAFAALEGLPHVAGFAGNMLGERAQAVRLGEVISGELHRRQELFRAAGHVANVADYRRTGRPLPSLVIVVEEFSGLLNEEPSFLEVLVAVGRVGRSLGVHLVLSSQRYEEGRLRGLGDYLPCRIAMRTFSRAESRAVLGIPDAYELPSVPGHGLLRTGSAPPQPFRAAYASPPHRRPSPPTWEDILREARSFGPPSVLDVLVERITAYGDRARPLWLPPLNTPIALADVLGEPRTDPSRGLTVDPPLGDRRLVPIGLVDRPLLHARSPLVVDLRGDAGHVALVGRPEEWRAALRTLLLAVALLHTPDETRVFAVVPDAEVLGPVAGLPHIAGVAHSTDPGAVTAMQDRMAVALAEGTARTLLVVADGAASAQVPLDGLHVIAAAGAWTGLDAFRQRIELRLDDPAQSTVSRRAAALIPYDQPGRGLTGDGLHVRLAAPELTADAGTAPLVAAIAAAWSRTAGP